jgi:tRNA (guanine37-N1)-methyltransferase
LRKRLGDKLSGILPSEELNKFYSSFDIVGNIAIIKIPCFNIAGAKIVAKQIMVVHRNIKTVLTPITRISGDFRIREFKLLAGENKMITNHKESGCTFKVDIEKCYFSPRLSHEHSRIVKLVKSGEIVVNMFAGIGCFSILIAKKVSQTKVFSIDINPVAVQYMTENIRINRLYGKVIPLLGDSKEIVQADLQGKAERVLMPLPEKSLEYLPYALSTLKKQGGWIHFYSFQHAVGNENPIEKAKQAVAERLDALNVSYDFTFSHVVRSTGPNWYQTVIDIAVGSVLNKF